MLLYLEKDFADVIKLRILNRADVPGLSVGELNAVTNVLKSERQREFENVQRERQCEDGAERELKMLDLKIK